MKKKIIVCMLSLVLVFSLCGCNTDLIETVAKEILQSQGYEDAAAIIDEIDLNEAMSDLTENLDGVLDLSDTATDMLLEYLNQ